MSSLTTPMLDDSATKLTKTLDKLTAYKLRYQHRLTYQAIADLHGVSKQYVYQLVRGVESLMGDPEQRAAQEQVFPEAVESVRWKLLASLADEGKLSKAGTKDIALALEKTDKISRLERGKATDHRAILTKLITQNDDTLFSPK